MKIPSIDLAFWTACYEAEEARQAHAERAHLLREALACIALAVLRIVGRLA